MVLLLHRGSTALALSRGLSKSLRPVCGIGDIDSLSKMPQATASRTFRCEKRTGVVGRPGVGRLGVVVGGDDGDRAI